MTRKVLLEYFKKCLKSLNSGGSLILELAGGPGMIEEVEEKKVVFMGKGRKFRYTWDQQEFDPITHEGLWAIHFELMNGKKFKNAFVYKWRLWTIPEIRDAMIEAGFKDARVYWEKQDKKDNFLGTYKYAKKADNDYCWITYIAGIKK